MNNELNQMAQVLRARAALTLDAGDAAGALRQLQDVYRLSRVVRYRATLAGYMATSPHQPLSPSPAHFP